MTLELSCFSKGVGGLRITRVATAEQHKKDAIRGSRIHDVDGVVELHLETRLPGSPPSPVALPVPSHPSSRPEASGKKS